MKVDGKYVNLMPPLKMDGNTMSVIGSWDDVEYEIAGELGDNQWHFRVLIDMEWIHGKEWYPTLFHAFVAIQTGDWYGEENDNGI